MEEFYKMLKDRQQNYDNQIDKLMKTLTPNNELMIQHLNVKLGELTMIIWKLEDLLNI